MLQSKNWVLGWLLALTALWGWDLANYLGSPFPLWLAIVAPIASFIFVRSWRDASGARVETHALGWRETFWFAPILVLFLVKAPFPDLSADVLNYHLYLQQPLDQSRLLASFFPGGIGTFLSPFSDRLFFPLQDLLGYRLGTIVNLALTFTIFLQLAELLGSFGDPATRMWRAPAALAILSCEAILSTQGTYMIDLVPMIFLIELLFALFQPADGAAPSLRVLGLWVALAVTAKLAVLPVLAAIIFALILKRGRRGLWLLLSAGALTALFMAPYADLAWRFTRNPFFPAFNAQFKSTYFPFDGLRDPRFGPHGLLQTLFFPILASIRALHIGEGSYYSGRLCAYVLAGMVVLKPRFKLELRLASAALLGALLFWEITSGYLRFALSLELGFGVLWLALILDSTLQSELRKGLIALLGIQVAMAWALAVTRSIADIHYPAGTFWSAYRENWARVFHDSPSSWKSALGGTDAIITMRPNGGLASLIAPQTPLVAGGFWWATPRIHTELHDHLLQLQRSAPSVRTFQLKYDPLHLSAVSNDPTAHVLRDVPFLPTWNSTVILTQDR